MASYWIRGDDGVEYGPVGADELREWVRENRAGIDTLVRPDEPGTEWRPWQAYPELLQLLAAEGVLPPLPLGGQRPAPLGRRVAAGLLDLIFVMLLIIPVVAALLFVLPEPAVPQLIVAALRGQPPPALPSSLLLLVSAVEGAIIAGYMAGFLAAHGRTPAKSIFGLEVVDETGKKPALVRALLRGVVFALSLSLYGAPLLYVLFNPQRRALHDFVAGTYVVEWRRDSSW